MLILIQRQYTPTPERLPYRPPSVLTPTPTTTIRQHKIILQQRIQRLEFGLDRTLRKPIQLFHQ